MTSPRVSTCVVGLHNSAVLIGGRFGHNSTYLSTVESYNTLTKEWKALPNMKEPRSEMACIFAEIPGYGKGQQRLSSRDEDLFVNLYTFSLGIVVAGGQGLQNRKLKSVEFLPIDQEDGSAKGNWRSLPDLKVTRASYPSIGFVGDNPR